MHNTLDRAYLTHRHAPALGCGLAQHDPRGRTAAANIVLRGAYAAAAACAHFTPGTLARKTLPRRGEFGLHLAPITLQLFGHQLREAGERALSHFRARDADHAVIIGLHHHPHIDFGAFGLGAEIAAQGGAQFGTRSTTRCARSACRRPVQP